MLLALSLLVAWCCPAGAHELGPFQVYGTFLRDGSFRLDVKIDEEHLAPGQLGGPGRPTRYGRIAGLSGATEQRFGRFLSDLADSLTLSFDGVTVTPTLAMDPQGGGDVAGGAPSRATLLVAGWIPGGARGFTFASSLRVKSYPLVLRCEGDESSSWRWMAGGETSAPFQLAAGVVPPPRIAFARRCFALGFDRVLPHGPAPLLLVAAVFLLVRRVRAGLLLLAALTLGEALGLTLALGGGVPVRPSLLEPLLALSVAALALAGLAPPPRSRPGPGRHGAGLGLALALAAAIFAVGALCGLALAPAAPGALPPPLRPAAATGFIAGAAAAELAVLAAAFVLIGLPFRDQPWYRRRLVAPASCLIALVALYWSLSGLLG
ncbi:MAG TPA: HupE/UreJ family protein [Thermoanaerobaculia bacterium]|nr:HupE/UreJ family protein [Thermoanaerobaculia bacterium]